MSTSRNRAPRRLLAALVLLAVLASAAVVTAVVLRGGSPLRTTGVAAASPSPRHDAAMAFDSTSGMTVLFGGVGADGRRLADTWEWDGSAWHGVRAGGGPAGLDALSLADDPADGGILALGASAGATPCACPLGTPPATETWVYASQRWTRVSGLPGAEAGASPGRGAVLGYDPAGRGVVAVRAAAGDCLPSFAGPASRSCATLRPGFGCALPTACLSGLPCLPIPIGPAACGIDTWTWAAHHWTHEDSHGREGPAGTVAALVTDGSTKRLQLVTALRPAPPPWCVAPATCAVQGRAPAGQLWDWTGHAWSSAGVTSGVTPGVQVSAASVAGVVVDTAGNLVALEGAATHPPAHSPPRRTGAAVALDRRGGLVLFGGSAVAGSMGTAAAAPGADTWRWDGSDWQHVLGAFPSSSPGPQSGR